MGRRPLRIAFNLVLGMAALGLQFPLAVRTVDGCGTSVGGHCVVPPDPVIVEGPTGPVMVDGLEASLTASVNVSIVNGQRIIDAVYPHETINGVPAASTSPNAVNILNQGTGDDNGFNWGGCGGSDACSNVEIIRAYTGNWSPQGSFDAYGPAVFNWLEPNQHMDRQYYLWSMHSQVTSKDSNKTTLCILTNSTEIEGYATPQPQIVDWSPGAPYPVGSGQQVAFNAGTAWNGTGIGISSTWNVPQGQIEGKVYQPNDNFPNTGYVGAWEQQRGCQPSVEMRNGVIWAQQYRQNDDTTFKIAANVWYASSN